MNKVVVIDYGMGNLKSIQRGLEKVGGKVILSSNYSDVVAADRIILPGVGAFEGGIKGLKDFELITAIDEFKIFQTLYSTFKSTNSGQYYTVCCHHIRVI
jgi:glutamine amidotransferase